MFKRVYYIFYNFPFFTTNIKHYFQVINTPNKVLHVLIFYYVSNKRPSRETPTLSYYLILIFYVRDIEAELIPALRRFGIRFYVYNPVGDFLITFHNTIVRFRIEDVRLFIVEGKCG